MDRRNWYRRTLVGVYFLIRYPTLYTTLYRVPPNHEFWIIRYFDVLPTLCASAAKCCVLTDGVEVALCLYIMISQSLSSLSFFLLFSYRLTTHLQLLCNTLASVYQSRLLLRLLLLPSQPRYCASKLTTLQTRVALLEWVLLSPTWSTLRMPVLSSSN